MNKTICFICPFDIACGTIDAHDVDLGAGSFVSDNDDQENNDSAWLGEEIAFSN